MKIYFVCHCVLNTCSKTRHEMSADYTSEEIKRRCFLEKILKNGDQIIQLPCPEFLQYGHCRWGHARSQFDNPFFRASCRKMLSPIVAQMMEYSAFPTEFEIEIVGINGSPSCGVDFSFDGQNWGGEFSSDPEKNPASGYLNQKSGIFMSVLSDMLRENNLTVPITSLT